MKNKLLIISFILITSYLNAQNTVCKLDGDGDKLEFILQKSHKTNLNKSYGFTVEMWVNASDTQLSSNSQLFTFLNNKEVDIDGDILNEKTGESEIPISIGINKSNEITLCINGIHERKIKLNNLSGIKIKSINDNLKLTNTKLKLEPNKWVFLSITFNKNNGSISIYFDGKLQKTIVDFNLKNIYYLGFTKFVVCDFSDNDFISNREYRNNSLIVNDFEEANKFGNFKGKVDEVRIWSKILTQKEILNYTYAEPKNISNKILHKKLTNVNAKKIKGNPVFPQEQIYYTYLGKTDDNYGLTEFWLYNKLPVNNSNIGIAPKSTITGVTSSYTYNNIIVSEGATLNVAGKLNIGKELIVNGILTANSDAELNLHTASITNNGEITLENSASLYQGYFDEETKTCTNKVNTENGIWHVKRNSPNLSNDNIYNFWSTPVYGVKAGEAFNGTDPTKQYRWLCNTQSWRNLKEDEILNPGEGYTIFGQKGLSGIQERTFSGDAIANGEIKVKIERNEEDAYCIIGNPYPSAIDWIKVAKYNPNIINGTAYIWIQNSDVDVENNESTDYGDYAIINASGIAMPGNAGIDPSQYISSSQAFAVEMIETGDVTFNNCMRVNGNNQSFYKKEISTSKKLWLNLSNNIKSSQLLLNFDKNATDRFDRMYDGKLISESKTNIYTTINDSIKLCIEGRDADFENETIKLGYSTESKSNYTFSVSKTENMDDIDILLLDNETMITTNLQHNSYYCELNKAENIEDRFEISFGTKQFLTNTANKNISTIIYGNNNQTIIKYCNAIIKNAEIIDLSGNKIKTTYNHNKKIINHLGLNKGVYIVKLKTNKGYVNKIIII